MRSLRLSAALGTLFLAGLACQAPTSSAQQVDTTAVAGTVEAAASQTAAARPTATPTPEPPPTVTPAPTDTPAATPTAPPSALLNENTNCRTGPLVVYDLITTIARGQRVEIVGRSAASDYWYVRDPGNPERGCWMWGRYAEVSESAGEAPVFTPPPSPTPSATPTPLVYDWAGSWVVWIGGVQGSMTLFENGDSISGDLIHSVQCFIETCRIEGTQSNGGRVVSGEVTQLTVSSKFSWTMADTLNQFTGELASSFAGGGTVAFCGARSGAPMPEPCGGP